MIQKAVPGLVQVYIVCVNKGHVMSLEDSIMDIYNEVREKGLQIKFDKQLAKMSTQDKHAHKTANEKWDYALRRIQGWDPNKSKK
jgi:histidyl-tRNA synthetase